MAGDELEVHRLFLRVKVEMNVNQPLVKGAWVWSSSGVTYLVDFWYERLLAFCFNCGRLDHNIKVCKKEKVLNEDDGFGAGLRAGQARGSLYVLNKIKGSGDNRDKKKWDQESVSGVATDLNARAGVEKKEQIQMQQQQKVEESKGVHEELKRTKGVERVEEVEQNDVVEEAQDSIPFNDRESMGQGIKVPIVVVNEEVGKMLNENVYQ